MASSAQAPPSPSASFYDLSDDEEGEYNTIRHTSSGKGVKLLYTKSKVYVHPTPSSKDNIPGFIALIQQRSSRSASDTRPTSSSSSQSVSASSLLLCWIPESSLGDAYDTYVKVDLSDSSSPPRQSYLVPPPPTPSTHSVTPGYAFALPVSEIYSILVRPPSIGWWFGSVVVNSRAGDSFPALFFHDSECQSTIMQRKKLAKENFDPFGDGGGMFWGGDEVLRWLKRYVTVERSGADPSIYLIDPTEEDKKSFGKAIAPRKSTENQAEASSSQQGAKRDGGMDPVTKALKEARWNFLEKLSQVTTFTRRTAQAVADNPKIPPQVRRLIQNPEVQTLQEEFDSARLYLARWAMGIAEQSERERNQRIWTAKDVLAMEESDVGDFEILDMDKMTMADRRKPVTLEEWKGFFDSKGRLQLMPDEVKDRIFHGGLDPDDGVRKEAWLFLLGVYQWESSEEERRAHINSLRDEYIRLKGAWWERMVEGHESLEQEEWWREQKNRIEKDVHRTDRNIPIFTGEDIPHPDPDSPFADVGTNVHLEQMKDMLLTYNEYNKGLGYVQGMSDLLAPIYAVMQDDAVAFWGFVGFMDRMERNFLRDQSGMRKQLLTLDHLVQLMDPKLYLHLQSAESTNFFFFFRMLLVWYKREFEWADVLRLWESLWTDYMSSNFHIFIALAILEKHREIIMAHLKHFDEVLKYVNELSGTMDLESTLVRAESLFKRFQRTVETIDKKGNFPSAPQARQRKPGAASAVDPGRGPQASSSGTDSGKQVSEGEQETRVISPELRALLSRKVEKLDREKILEHGGGVGKLRSRPHSHHKHKRRRRRREMTSFTGPWSSDLDSFKKSVQSMPEQYRSSFATCSKKALDKICDRKALHIWESDSDIDSLLQLTSVIAKLCDLGVRKKKGANAKDGSMLIIAEENSSGSNFDRICELVEYLTCAKPRKHLEGTVTVYSKIVVVRGWDNSVLSGQREALEKTVRRINIAIERVLKMGGFEGKKRKLVWHHNAVIPFLLHWINTTTPALRSSISAITVTGSLDFETGIGPSLAGRANKVADLERLEQYTKKLGVPVVFLDSSSQLINSEYLGTYMYYYAYYINTFLPTCLSRPHLEKAQDELVTFAFRMRAASEAKYRNEAVKLVKKYLDPRTAKAWAHHCINESSYEKPKCRAAGRDESIHHAVQIADCPFARFSATPGVPSFARLAAGPASAASSEYYTAAPVSIAFTKSLFRPCRPATFYLLIPHATHDDEEKVTSRIQGLMMAVLERVRQEKGNPVLGDDEKDMWRNVVKACSWALDGIEDKMPKEMARKVRFVRQKLKAGTWGYAVNAPVADAAGVLQQQPQTVQEMNRPYAFEAGAAVQDPAAAGYAGNQQVPLVNGQTGQGTTYPQQQVNGQLPPPQTVFTHGGVYPSPGLGPTSSLPHRGSGRGFS